MADKTNIAWCDSTGGPWFVCTEVSSGCRFCYARELAETRLAPMIRKSYRAAGFADWETRPVWGDQAPRVLSKGFWTDIAAFNRRPWICDACGSADIRNLICNSCGEMNLHRRRCFPSLIDWLDDMPAGIIDQNGGQLDPVAVLGSFLEAMRVANEVTLILCTKRPQNFFTLLEKVLLATDDQAPLFKFVESWLQGFPPRNVVGLLSVENQKAADDRMVDFLKIPFKCRGLSLEPLLGPVELGLYEPHEITDRKLDWLIIGGESGPNARPCNVEWIRSVVAQGNAAGVATFVKQLGSNPRREFTRSCGSEMDLRDKKGGDKSEWPSDLQIQNWPKGY